jgi:hypothetical protein
MLMAGLDGIQNRIHPGDPMGKNLYDLPPEELKDVPTVCGSLREAVEHLRADHAFLTKATSSPATRSRPISSSSGKRSTPSSTRRTRSSSRCTTASSVRIAPQTGASADALGGGDFFFFGSRPRA